VYFDGTLGGGGHAYEILRRSGPDGLLIGVDVDDDALAEGARRLEPFGARAVLGHGSYADIREIITALGIGTVDGILIDLGVSSHQLATRARGFSFTLDAPLDMRMDRRRPMNAYDVVNSYSREQLRKIIREYGEETMAARIAEAITERRRHTPIRTTAELAALVVQTLPPAARRKKIHPATKTFQALRIAVNDELASLRRAIDAGLTVLAPGGRFSIISFHSLEDRMVKERFRTLEKGCTCPPDLPACACGLTGILNVITKRPIMPTAEEIAVNPQARSARLRTAERI
jgi:16S rRNA (cytosine1402-N4)-methyltransferase